MNYSNQWYIPNQILYVQYWGETTGEIAAQQVKELFGILDQTSADSIHVIVDTSFVTKPLAVKDLPALLNGYKPHPKYRWTLMVGHKNALIRFVTAVGSQLLRKQVRMFETADEALAFLKQIDPTLNWAQAQPAVLAEPAAQLHELS